MLPESALEPFDSAEYQFEVAWDAHRVLAFISKEGLELRDRRGRDVLALFPELGNLSQAVDPESVIDGEIAICDAEGRPDPSALARRLRAGRAERAAHSSTTPAVLLAYDLLYLRGTALLNTPLTRRQALLRESAHKSANFCLPDAVERDGIAFFDAALEKGLGGMIAKRKDSRYLPGRRSPDWLLVEAVRRDDFLVIGWLPPPPGGRLPFEALALATHEQGQLRYVGQVAGGFEERDRERIMTTVRGLFRATPPAADVPDTASFRWLEPRLVVRVKFSEWSPDRRLRFPIFVGLREDVAPHEVQVHGGVTVPPASPGRSPLVVPTLPLS
jgi:bifunctional non-homologous end joining protein LigD